MPKREFQESKLLFSRLLAISQFKEKGVLDLDIESDTQYQQDNIFYSEGNVIVFFDNAKLKADKLSFDREKSLLTIIGNISFFKGSQYFQAEKLIYNFNQEKGFIEDIYGVLDLNKINKDLNIKVDNFENKNTDYEKFDVTDFEYINSSKIGLVNDFESDKRFNITDVTLEVPTITKWRFKAERIDIDSTEFKSEKVIFTNDPYNRPQFFFISNKFRGFIKDDKLKLISRNSWINLDDKFKFPIGRRSITDRDPLSKWTFGSNHKDKDGFYVSRSFDPIIFNNDYNLIFRPYLLLQRGINDSTNAFTSEGASLLDSKVRNEIKSSDLFGLDTDLNGKLNSWDFKLNTSLNSLNLKRLSESFRSKITFSKKINLKKIDNLNTSSSLFKNDLDIQISSAFREEVFRGYDGDSEVYFGNNISLSNRRQWSKNNVYTNLALITDFGKYKAKAKNKNEFKNHFRNIYSLNLSNEFPIITWYEDGKINKDYKYTPKVIKQGIDWVTDLRTGIFFYDDGSSQRALTLSTGPDITIGGFKKNWFNYTNVKIKGNLILKGGESPFTFDDINDTRRMKFRIEQQIYGPLVINYDAYLNLDSDNTKYGELEREIFGLDIKRRSYSVGAYYKPSDEEVGVKFELSNFGYDGKPDKF